MSLRTNNFESNNILATESFETASFKAGSGKLTNLAVDSLSANSVAVSGASGLNTLTTSGLATLSSLKVTGASNVATLISSGLATLDSLQVTKAGAALNEYHVIEGGGQITSGFLRSYASIPDAVAAAIADGNTGINKGAAIIVHQAVNPWGGDVNGEIVLPIGCTLRGYAEGGGWGFLQQPKVAAHVKIVNDVPVGIPNLFLTTTISGILFYPYIADKPTVEISQTLPDNSGCIIGLNNVGVVALVSQAQGIVKITGKNSTANLNGCVLISAIAGPTVLALNDAESITQHCNLVGPDDIIRIDGPVDAPIGPFPKNTYVYDTVFDGFTIPSTGTMAAIRIKSRALVKMQSCSIFYDHAAPSPGDNYAILVDPGVTDAKIHFMGRDNWASLRNSGPASRILSLPIDPSVVVYGTMEVDPTGQTSSTVGANYVANATAGAP